jgi:hypothetical protein
MKKLFFLLVMMVGLSVQAMAKDVITRDVNQLPQAARTTIQKYFPKAKLSYIKIDKDFLEAATYEAIFEDGTQIDFNSKGEWTEVDSRLNPVPEALIPASIKDYLKRNFPNIAVEKIERHRKGGYEVELKNDYSVEFDALGNFLKMDD